MPAPLIEFAQFVHPQRWWLRRGEPPWLDDSRWWARAFRVSLVLGVMGTATGWLTVIAAASLRTWESQHGSYPNSELVIFLGPGFWFGLGVLMPLSRWLGRGWVMSLLAIPMSMFASLCGIMGFLFADPIMGSGLYAVPGGKEAAGFYAGFAGAFVVAVWMGHPRRKSAWLAGALAAGLASLSGGIVFLAQSNWELKPVPSGIRELLEPALVYVSFQSLTAAGLGVRLWQPARSSQKLYLTAVSPGV